MARKSKKTNKNKSFSSAYSHKSLFSYHRYNFLSTPLSSFPTSAGVRKLVKPFLLHPPTSPHSPVYRHKQFNPKSFKYHDTKFRNVCYNRKVRKEVLFALRKIGFGIPVRIPRFTQESKIRCK